MKSRHITRRELLVRGGMLVGSAALVPALPDGVLRRAGKEGLWLHRAYASAGPFDPVPAPGPEWTKEGTGGFVQATTPPLVVNDGGTGAGQFCNLYAAADFAVEQLVTPRLAVDPGFVEDPSDGNLGVHVSFNDGTGNRVARAVLLKTGPSQVRVAVARAGAYSTGFVFPGLVADFVFRRLTNGDVTLQALGQPEELTPAGALPVSPRPGARTIEFGTYDVPADCVTRWETLGLPPVSQPLGLSFRDLRLQDADTRDMVRMLGTFTLGASSDGINPATELVSLILSSAGVFYSKAFPAGSFEFRAHQSPRRWRLTDAARSATGVERFDILEEGSFTLVDRQTAVPAQNYPLVSVELTIGHDSGTQTEALEERPAGSGSWRLVR